MSRNPRRWTREEDRILLEKGKELFSEGEKGDMAISWSSVSKLIANRNNKDCRKRWYKLTGVKKGLWAASEDERLLEGVQKHGSQWALVAKMVETRNADQCAKRWQHCLDPSLDRSEWTNETDARLIAAVNRHGTNWKEIKKLEFPMRSNTNLKNRHMALLRQLQSNKGPSVAPSKSETAETSIEWLSIEQEMLDSMIGFGNDDGDCLDSDHNESSRASTSTSPFRNNLGLGFSPSESWLTDTTPISMSASPSPYPLSQHRELPSRTCMDMDMAQTSTSCYTPFEDFLESISSHATDAKSAHWEDINNGEPCVPEFRTLTMSPARQANINASSLQTSDSMRSGGASYTHEEEAKQLPQSVASSVSPSVSQMTLTIDNPEPQMVSSILEVLAKAKSKVTMSMNT